MRIYLRKYDTDDLVMIYSEAMTNMYGNTCTVGDLIDFLCAERSERLKLYESPRPTLTWFDEIVIPENLLLNQITEDIDFSDERPILVVQPKPITGSYLDRLGLEIAKWNPLLLLGTAKVVQEPLPVSVTLKPVDKLRKRRNL